jgi:phage/plasmid-associated DNA primase
LAEQRFIWLDFKQSFADNVDPRIKQVYLPAELPGIANRCLAGYRRLLERGKFIQPKSGERLVEFRQRFSFGRQPLKRTTYWLVRGGEAS